MEQTFDIHLIIVIYCLKFFFVEHLCKHYLPNLRLCLECTQRFAKLSRITLHIGLTVAILLAFKINLSDVPLIAFFELLAIVVLSLMHDSFGKMKFVFYMPTAKWPKFIRKIFRLSSGSPTRVVRVVRVEVHMGVILRLILVVSAITILLIT